MIDPWALAAALSIGAAVTQGPGPDQSLDPMTRPPIEGHVTVRTLVSPLRVVADDRLVDAWVTMRVAHQAARGPFSWRAGLRAEVITDRALQGPAFDLADRGARRPVIAIEDLSLRASLFSGVGIELGRLRPAWARTDGYSPVEAFLPRDLTDPFAEEVLPVWAGRLELERGPVRVDGFHAFTTTPWRMPVMTGRLSPFWWLDVFLDDPMGAPPRRGFTMGRVMVSARGWDVAGWVRTGIRPAPVFEPDRTAEVVTPEGTRVPSRRRFAKEDAAGLSVSRATGAWVVHGEAAYLRSPDPDVQRALTWSVGADRAARNGLITVTLSGNAINTPIDPLGLPDRAFLPYFVASSTQEEDWGRWQVSWLGTLERIGGIVKAEVRRTLTPDVSLAAGVDLPHGSRTSSPGAISRARRGHLTLHWYW